LETFSENNIFVVTEKLKCVLICKKVQEVVWKNKKSENTTGGKQMRSQNSEKEIFDGN
jgi:hypothetical protein